MHRSLGYLRNKEQVSILVISLFLTGFVGFLLTSNYRSLQRLRDNSLKQYQYEIETRGRNLSHFLRDQQQRITNLAKGGKLELYFENKALGMSMEYGLRSTMVAIGRNLSEFVSQQHFGTEKIYHRVAFFEAQGEVIADSGHTSSILLEKEHWKKLLYQLPDGYYVIQSPATTGQDFIFTRPYYFKNRYVGQIAAWLRTDTLRQLLRAGKAARFTGLLGPSNRLINIRTDVARQTSSIPTRLFSSVHHYGEIVSFYEATESVLAFEVPVGDTTFQLLNIAAAKSVIGATSPRTLLLAMVLLFIGLLGAAAVIMRMIAHNIVLQTRVEESKKRENDIERKNLQLQAEIEERKRSEKARVQLEAKLQRVQKMDAIGMLAGGVAHDLNNILSGLVSYPDLLLLELPVHSPMRESIMTIKDSGRKAAAIVQDLLTLARRGVATSEVVNFNQVVGDYLASPEHRKLREFHPQVTIETQLSPELLNVSGSPVHLSKTVMNLVSNAAEALPSGGRIDVVTENRYIDRPVKGYDDVAEGDYAILRISDNGIGISAEDLNRIFEPFYTKKVMGRSGTGLGMAVVWSTVKDHEGYIDVESFKGRGTTVTLYFPATSEQLLHKVAGTSFDELKGEGQSILVVDDIPQQLTIAGQILHKLGYTVARSPSGEEAIEFLQNQEVDLVLLDMIMDPGIDGLETYREILKLHPFQKAVIASGFSETERVREAQRLGVGAYIKKPYTLEGIGKVVRDVLATAN